MWHCAVARFSPPLPAMHILEFFLFVFYTLCAHMYAKCAYSCFQEWVGGFIKYFLLRVMTHSDLYIFEERHLLVC